MYIVILLTVHDTLKAVELIGVTKLRVGALGTERERVKMAFISLAYLVVQFQ